MAKLKGTAIQGFSKNRILAGTHWISVFVRNFSSGTAAYVVPLIEKIGGASAAIDAARGARERDVADLM